MDLDRVVIIVGFSLWLGLSILRQCAASSPRWLGKIDIFGLAPSWRFFGPVPMRCDYRLFFRDRLRNGGVYGWVEITPFQPPDRWRWLWNPDRRLRKAFEVSGRALSRKPSPATLQNEPSGLEEICGSKPYLTVRNYVVHLPPAPEGVARQFALTASRDLADDSHAQILFLSRFHPIAGCDGPIPGCADDGRRQSCNEPDTTETQEAVGRHAELARIS